MFVDGQLVGAVDRDTAVPGPRVWDLAYLAYRLVLLTGATDVVVPGDGLPARARRLRLLCETYGAAAADPTDRRRGPAEVLDAVVGPLEALAGFTAARADEGDESVRPHVALYRADMRWVVEHAARLADAASDA